MKLAQKNSRFDFRKPSLIKGQLLIESIIAISMITIGLLGIFSLLSQSLGLRRVVSERYSATYLAAEAVEIVKNTIDTNYIKKLPWNQNLSTVGDYELDYDDQPPFSVYLGKLLKYDSGTGIYSYNFGDETQFKRKVTISYPDGNANRVRVNVLVEWITRGEGKFSVNVEDHFYNWR